MNNPVYLGVLILEISKTLMCECRYNYIKPKYQNNAKLCYMYTGSFIIHIKTEDFYKDIANHVKKLSQTSTYSQDKKRPRSRGINKKVIGLMKDELGGKIMIELVALRPKPYSSLMDDDKGVKKVKETKKCLKNWRFKFTNYKDCSLKNKIILKSQ